MADYFEIGKGKLKAYVAAPGGYYDRRRFDWTGFIPRLEYAGKPVATVEGPAGAPGNTGGAGLCSEFKTDTCMGWDEEDDLFLKPGVGLLKREDDGPYAFTKDYPLVQPFACEVTAGESTVDFHLSPIAFKGFAYEEYKHVGMIGDALTITTTVHNVGEKPLSLQEYNHNFLSLNGNGAHEDVFLKLHKGYYKRYENPGVVEKEEGITFNGELKSSFMIYSRGCPAYSPLRWEMTDTRAGLKAQEWGDFSIALFNAWGTPNVISPEVFCAMELAPNASYTWTRLWKVEEL